MRCCAGTGTREVDAELAVLACSVHDYGRIVTGKQDNHPAAGFERSAGAGQTQCR
ncbi:MAG: hypothetical protein AB1512_16990 [Thermodesulfobacteriota bacterium]